MFWASLTNPKLTILSPFIQRDIEREFKVIIDFLLDHRGVIKFKAFQRDKECIGELLEVAPLDGVDFTFVLFTVVFVLAFKDITLNEEF